MGYHTDDSMVRVDFFKPSGKWYETRAVRWTGGYKDCAIHNAFAKSLRDHFAERDQPTGFADMDAICLEPHHEHSHPIMLKQGKWLEL